ncbi:hypothetical protein TcWFU_004638 [Taenia crassiceps]|uniref:Uncharacterized protein n=1 Tax=Taenia crassiceps TaxID=6207 RepID=A0ABR4QR58_9CEST
MWKEIQDYEYSNFQLFPSATVLEMDLSCLNFLTLNERELLLTCHTKKSGISWNLETESSLDPSIIVGFSIVNGSISSGSKPS